MALRVRRETLALKAFRASRVLLVPRALLALMARRVLRA